MKAKEFAALKLERGDSFEAMDKKAISPNCHRRIVFRHMHKSSRSLFHADWQTRTRAEQDYEGAEMMRDGVFDCGDLTLVGDVQRGTVKRFTREAFKLQAQE